MNEMRFISGIIFPGLFPIPQVSTIIDS